MTNQKIITKKPIKLPTAKRQQDGLQRELKEGKNRESSCTAELENELEAVKDSYRAEIQISTVRTGLRKSEKKNKKQKKAGRR